MFGNNLGIGEIFELLEGIQDKIIVELGANNGSTTKEILSRMSKTDKLYAIEADYRCIKKIQDSIDDNRLILLHAAITSINGSGIFHCCTGEYAGYGLWDCASSLKPIKHGLVVNPWLKYEDDQTVIYITLDTFCENNNIDHIDFIWCDVEGAYAEVVEGGLKTLSRTSWFYTECEDVETYEGEIMYPALRDKMESLGWELVHRFNYDALFRNLK